MRKFGEVIAGSPIRRASQAIESLPQVSVGFRSIHEVITGHHVIVSEPKYQSSTLRVSDKWRPEPASIYTVTPATGALRRENGTRVGPREAFRVRKLISQAVSKHNIHSHTR